MQQRRQLVKTTKQYGLHVQPAALLLMLQYSGDDSEVVSPILDCLQAKLARVSPKIITPKLWEEAVQEVTATALEISEQAVPTTKAKNTTKKTLPPNKNKHTDWHVVDAFNSPTLVYDSLRQQFHYATNQTRPSLFGTVEDKIEMMAQRFLRVQQRVARSVSYLTSIDRLLGTSATSTQTLLGLLHATARTMSQADGVAATGFELEDLTGSIPLQLHSSTQLDTQGVYTDGCLVLVEGYYDDGIFVVHELKLPHIEAKTKSKPFIPSGPIGISSTQTINTLPLILYTMANVALDDPIVLQHLEELVLTLSAQETSTEKVVLILMGNFTTNTMTLPLALEELSRVLEPLPACHTVLILPGPNDTPSMCWPIPSIRAPPSFSQHLRVNVEFVSNPCRLQYGDQQEVLLYRNDMIRQHLQHEILSVQNDEQAIMTRIFHTVLSQGHLSPQAPIYWNYDHGLAIYPLPDLMLLGLEEGEEKIQSYAEAECQVVAPGSHGKWAKVTLHPHHKRRGARRPLLVEFSQVDNKETEEDSVVDDSMDED